MAANYWLIRLICCSQCAVLKQTSFVEKKKKENSTAFSRWRGRHEVPQQTHVTAAVSSNTETWAKYQYLQLGGMNI